MVFNTAPDMKLAHSLAKQITRDIVAGGLSADQLLGREADLRARYSVSRDTFREAFLHGIKIAPPPWILIR